MCVYDRTRNKVPKDKVAVVLIEDRIRETRLRYFGRVKRRSMDTSICKEVRVD